MPPPPPRALNPRRRWLRRLVLAGAAALGSALVIVGHLALESRRSDDAPAAPDARTAGEVRFQAAYPLGATPPFTVVSNHSAAGDTDPIDP